MLHKGTTDGPRHRDLGRGFFWLDTIRSIRIDSREEIDTIFRYVASALPRFSIRYSIHCYVRASCVMRMRTMYTESVEHTTSVPHGTRKKSTVESTLVLFLLMTEQGPTLGLVLQVDSTNTEGYLREKYPIATNLVYLPDSFHSVVKFLKQKSNRCTCYQVAEP